MSEYKLYESVNKNRDRITDPNLSCKKEECLNGQRILIREEYCAECLIDELLEGFDILKKSMKKLQDENLALKRALGMEAVLGYKPNKLGDKPASKNQGLIDI